MNSIIEAQVELEEQQKLELKRCEESPFYFAVNYIKEYRTYYTEEEFNEIFKRIKNDNWNIRQNRIRKRHNW